MPSESSLVAGMRYRNGPAAIDFLCKAFGFERQLVVLNDAGDVAHAQLTLGKAMIMLGSAPSPDLTAILALPEEVGGCVTATLYIHVADPDTHYAQAKAAGAVIVREIADQAHGGRDYMCRDQESHVWQFGSYDPWRVPSASQPDRSD
jgi:uncharacterized glyoxalase superfamily protein PhnB